MVGDEEDDYLSDKFLLASSSKASSKPQTYAERRKAAQRTSETLNVANRKKSRRAREEESREEGLGVSLFERARNEQGGSKALGLMKMMGYKEGEALGAKPDLQAGEAEVVEQRSGVSRRLEEAEEKEDNSDWETPRAGLGRSTSAGLGAITQHRKVPLPVDIWSGELSFLYRGVVEYLLSR